MMIAKGLTLVSVLWNLSAHAEAPFLDHQPVRGPEPVVAASAPAPAPSVAAVPAPAPSVAAVPAPAPSVAAVPAPAPVPSVAASPVNHGPLPPQRGPVLTAIHVTGWVAQVPSRMQALIEASKKAGLTAMIFECKDVNGDLFFKMETAGGINRFAEDIKLCHAAGIKVIARYAVFKDKALEEKNAAARYGTSPGTDTRHKPWTNPVSKATVEYNLGLIKELVAMGVDEINLD